MAPGLKDQQARPSPNTTLSPAALVPTHIYALFSICRTHVRRPTLSPLTMPMCSHTRTLLYYLPHTRIPTCIQHHASLF
jgi:hypothetical protein